MLLVLQIDNAEWPVDLVSSRTDYLAEVYRRAEGEMASLAVAVDRTLDRGWAVRAMWAIDHLGGKVELLRRELVARGALPEVRGWEHPGPEAERERQRRLADLEGTARVYRALVGVLHEAVGEEGMAKVWAAVRDRMAGEATLGRLVTKLPTGTGSCQSVGDDPSH